MAKKICMFVTNSVVRDPRVRREAGTLVKAGYQVVVVSLQATNEKDSELIDGFQVIAIKEPKLLTFRQAVLEGLQRLSPRLSRSLRILYRLLHHGSVVAVPGEPHELVIVNDQNSARSTWRQRLKKEQYVFRNLLWRNIEMARVAIRQGADIYHAHDLDTLLAGYLAKRRTGKPLVYDFHELYTEQYAKGRKTWVWSWVHVMLERLLVKRVDGLLTVCDSLGQWMSQRYSSKKALTVKNVPLYEDVGRVEITPRRERVILYHGSYSENRGLEQFVESARYLRSARVVLRGFGDMEDRLRRLVKQNGLEDKVIFSPPVPVFKLVQEASVADIGIAPFPPVCFNTRFCLPNKLFEYLMAGLAIAVTDLPEMRRIILEHDVGVLLPSLDPMGIATTLNGLLDDSSKLDAMKRRARHVARTIYNWEHESENLIRFYESMTVDNSFKRCA